MRGRIYEDPYNPARIRREHQSGWRATQCQGQYNSSGHIDLNKRRQRDVREDLAGRLNTSITM